jgi:hypothetical protein
VHLQCIRLHRAGFPMQPGLPHYAMRYLWDPYPLGSHRTRWPMGADQKCHPSRCLDMALCVPTAGKAKVKAFCLLRYDHGSVIPRKLVMRKMARPPLRHHWTNEPATSSRFFNSSFSCS